MTAFECFGISIAALGDIAGDRPGYRLRLHPGYTVGLGGAPVFGEAAGGGGGEERIGGIV